MRNADRAAQALIIAILIGCATVTLRALTDWTLQTAFPAFWNWWSKDNVSAPRDLIVTVGGLVTLGVAIWRTWITNIQAKAQARQADGAYLQAETARTQAQIAWKGQLAERFIKSAPLLGSDDVHQRTIALFALEEIANQSEEHAWGVVELLTAFVRERISIGLEVKAGAGKALGTAQTDIAQALDAIGRLNREWDNPQKYVNLASCDLSKYYLRGNFSRASFNHCKFSETTFSGCALKQASFYSNEIESLKFLKCTGPIMANIAKLDELNKALNGESEVTLRSTPQRGVFQNVASAASGNLTMSSAPMIS